MVYTLGVGTDEPEAETGITGDLAMTETTEFVGGFVGSLIPERGFASEKAARRWLKQFARGAWIGIETAVSDGDSETYRLEVLAGELEV